MNNHLNEYKEGILKLLAGQDLVFGQTVQSNIAMFL